MVDIVSATAGSLILRDTDGHTVFDSGEKLFQATTRLTGTKQLGPWTASWDPPDLVTINTDTLHALAGIHSSCDTVVGAFFVSTSGGYGVANLGWFNANGSYLHYHDAALFPSTNRVLLTEFATFAFVAASSNLYLHEIVKLRPGTGIGVPANSITIPQITFSYNVYVGSFV